MVDVGGKYNLDFEGDSIYKAAAQIKVFEDFFLRLGTNLDDSKNEKTTGKERKISIQYLSFGY